MMEEEEEEGCASTTAATARVSSNVTIRARENESPFYYESYGTDKTIKTNRSRAGGPYISRNRLRDGNPEISFVRVVFRLFLSFPFSFCVPPFTRISASSSYNGTDGYAAAAAAAASTCRTDCSND